MFLFYTLYSVFVYYYNYYYYTYKMKENFAKIIFYLYSELNIRNFKSRNHLRSIVNLKAIGDLV